MERNNSLTRTRGLAVIRYGSLSPTTDFIFEEAFQMRGATLYEELPEMYLSNEKCERQIYFSKGDIETADNLLRSLVQYRHLNNPQVVLLSYEDFQGIFDQLRMKVLAEIPSASLRDSTGTC